MRVLVLLALSVVGPAWSMADGGSWKLPSFYHSTDVIHEFFEKLQSNCPNAEVKIEHWGKDPPLQLVHIQKPVAFAGGVRPAAPKRTMLLFGEHARELISPETALQFARDLCGQNKDPAIVALASKVLAHSSFQIIPVANPKGRRMVEGGDVCKRVNENGVDLNRNWDDHWEANEGGYDSDTYPGSKAFSEPETQELKAMAEKYPPSTFITIHSGTLGMYTPFAYTNVVPTEPEKIAALKKMQAALKILDKKYCKCPSGAAGKEVGYLCPGTCLDYVYDKLNTPYSFAFEIYAKDEVTLHQEWEAKADGSLIETAASVHARDVAYAHAHAHDGHGHGHGHGHHLAKKAKVKAPTPSCFIQEGVEAMSTVHVSMSPDECFGFFNPPDEPRYVQTTQKWSRLFLELTDMMHGTEPVQRFAQVMDSAMMGASRAEEAKDAASASAAVRAIAKMKRISIKDSEAAVTKGSQALLQADASMTKRVAAKAAAKQKRRLRSLQIRPTFVHPYHSFKALDNDERIMSATQGVDEGYIGFQDTEAHFQADLPGAKGDPTDSIAAPGSGQGEGEMGYGETEVQGRR